MCVGFLQAPFRRAHGADVAADRKNADELPLPIALGYQAGLETGCIGAGRGIDDHLFFGSFAGSRYAREGFAEGVGRR